MVTITTAQRGRVRGDVIGGAIISRFDTCCISATVTAVAAVAAARVICVACEGLMGLTVDTYGYTRVLLVSGQMVSSSESCAA